MCEGRRNHICFYILMAILIALAVAKYAFLLNIHKLILTSIAILMALLGDKDEIFATVMCCIPLHNTINFSVSIIACSVVLVLKYFNEFKLNVHISLVLFMIIWELLHCLDGNFNVVYLVTTISPLIVLMIFMSSDVKDVDYLFVVRSMAIVWIGLCFVQLANFAVLTGGDLFSAFGNLQRLGVFFGDDDFKLVAINPNTLGIISILITTGLLNFFAVRKYEKIDLILVLFLLLFGMIASSKTFLVCFTTMTLLIVFGQYGGTYQKFKTFIFITFIASFVVGVEVLLFPETFEYYLKRFSDLDFTTGRDILMRVYYDFIVSNSNVLFFGIGLMNFKEKLTNVYSVYHQVPHNSIQEIIIAWGIPGMIMMIGLLFLIVTKEKNVIGKSIINYIPLLIILLKSMAGQLITSGYTMLALSFAYLTICQNFTIKKQCNFKNV